MIYELKIIFVVVATFFLFRPITRFSVWVQIWLGTRCR